MQPWLDRAAARRAFDRAARSGGPGFIAAEVERRMAERLDYIKHAPARILDAGGSTVLRPRYPKAQIVTLHPSSRRLASSRGAGSLGARVRAMFGAAGSHLVCADLACVPLASASCDMVWSNLALAGSPDAAATIGEWSRALRPGGLLMFTSFGPDTLRELAAAFRAADALPHVHPFIDMHDIGDLVAGAGFAQPVIDMEMLTLTYDDPTKLFAELRDGGLANAHVARRRGLTGRAGWQRMQEAYRTMTRDGRLPASFEVVYGHAWKAAPRKAPDGRDIIHLERRVRDPKTA